METRPNNAAGTGGGARIGTEDEGRLQATGGTDQQGKTGMAGNQEALLAH
mgnify:CR=1 FL=1